MSLGPPSKFISVSMADVMAQCTACGNVYPLYLDEGESQTLAIDMPTCTCSGYFRAKWKLVARSEKQVFFP